MISTAQAMEKVKGDAKLQEEFKKDPKKVLTDLGVDTAGKTVTSGELSDSDLEAVSGGCHKVGVSHIGCVTVG